MSSLSCGRLSRWAMHSESELRTALPAHADGIESTASWHGGARRPRFAATDAACRGSGHWEPLVGACDGDDPA